MKTRTILPLAAVLVALGGCSLVGRGPSGETVTEFHTLATFAEVELLGVGDVTVVPGDDYTVTVTTDATFIDGVEVEVANGTLSLDEHYDFDTRDLDVSFLVTVPSVERVSLTGVGNITVSDLDADAFVIVVAGAGNITVSGFASNVNASLAGTGNIDIVGLNADTIAVTLAGAGNIDVGDSDYLKVSLTGVGNITYGGNPEVHSTILGVGSVGRR